MEKKSVLVTGSTGFLGSHILEAFMTENGVRPIAACRDRSRLIPFSGEVREGDLTDPGYVRDVVEGVDVICHAAAWTSLWAHQSEEARYFHDPAIALIDTAVGTGVQRFVFDSSVIASGPRRDGSPVGDHDLGRPSSFWPHLNAVIAIEEHMRRRANGTAMVVLRCGHFVGERYQKGLLSLLLPRLRTHLVPWIAGGRHRVPLVDGRDLGRAFVLAATAPDLEGFESFNICGPSFPTMREVITFLAAETGVPLPHFSVPLSAAYAFGWLMETLFGVLPGEPFLTRSIVSLGEDWYAPSDLAKKRLGYEPRIGWKEAIRRQLRDTERRGHPAISLIDEL